jgi:hypothetical protein
MLDTACYSCYISYMKRNISPMKGSIMAENPDPREIPFYTGVVLTEYDRRLLENEGKRRGLKDRSALLRQIIRENLEPKQAQPQVEA